MKKVFFLFLFLLFVINMSSPGMCENCPEDTVKLFYTSMEHGDFDTMFSLITKDAAIESMSSQGIDSIGASFCLAKMVNHGNGTITIKDLKVTVKDQKRMTAIVEITYISEIKTSKKTSTDINDDIVTLLYEPDNARWVIKTIHPGDYK